MCRIKLLVDRMERDEGAKYCEIPLLLKLFAPLNLQFFHSHSPIPIASHIQQSSERDNVKLLTISCRSVVSKWFNDVNYARKGKKECGPQKSKVGHIKPATKPSNKHRAALEDKKCRPKDRVKV